MGGSASKNKGKSWERDICKFLGTTLGGSFIRVPNSGAFIGGSNASRKIMLSDGQVRQAKGDIVPPDDLLKLNIEAKNYQEIPFHHILDGCCQQLNDWLKQTETPADPGDVSFTIFKITRKGSWVAFRKHLLDEFIVRTHVIYCMNDDDVFVITNYEEFFTTNKEKIRALGANGYAVL